MGSIKKQAVNRPVPKSAKIQEKVRPVTAKERQKDPSKVIVIEQIATWTTRGGKQTSGVVITSKGRQFVRVMSSTYYARYRDAQGIECTVPTGCKDKSVARAKLAELEKTVERICAGVVTKAELQEAASMAGGIQQHIDTHVANLRNQKGKGKRSRESATHAYHVERSLRLIARECKLTTPNDISAEAIQSRVTSKLKSERLSNRTINAHVAALKSFCTKLNITKLVKFPMLDESDNKKRPRRAFTLDELAKLLFVARLRPLAELGRSTVHKPNPYQKRSCWKLAPLTLDNIEDAHQRGRIALCRSPKKLAQLIQEGIERELFYMVPVTTGLSVAS